MMEYGDCPVCNGTTRRLVDAANQKWKHIIAGYDPASDTLACDNCGGQTMSGRATGKVRLRADGSPCVHEYRGVQRRCIWDGTCCHCGDKYTIDSSD